MRSSWLVAYSKISQTRVTNVRNLVSRWRKVRLKKIFKKNSGRKLDVGIKNVLNINNVKMYKNVRQSLNKVKI